jgi:hypothetical protein
MSNLVISLPVFIHTGIINKHGSMPFSFRIIKVATLGYSFNNLIKTSNLPNWFLQWWDYFGCIYEVIKPHPLIENSYIYFKQKFKPSENEKKFPPILMFCFKLFFPWIYSWYFNYNTQHG